MSSIKFYQVGGSVRDSFIGLKSKDIDYAVEAPSFDAMREAIKERGGEIFLETPQFLTIRANVPGMGACDYVLCRKDGEYVDGRRPETVTAGTILDDLARRDFTMNAIAIAEDGTILDPFDGRKDISQGRIKCVGDAQQRFSEDGLRMLRALRFAVTKNFFLDTDIISCLHMESFFKPRLQGVSVERIREELYKMFVANTLHTLYMLNAHPYFRNHIIQTSGIWLKPTLEAR